MILEILAFKKQFLDRVFDTDQRFQVPGFTYLEDLCRSIARHLNFGTKKRCSGKKIELKRLHLPRNLEGASVFTVAI